MSLKSRLTKILSLGGMEELSPGKRFSLQIAVMDGYWSVIAFSTYVIWSVLQNHVQLFWVHFFCLLVMFVGLSFIYNKKYDVGRYVIFLGGLFAIFCGNDVFGKDSGIEYYYFVSIMMPFLTFSLEEIKKGIPLSFTAFFLCILQQILGTGLFFNTIPPSSADRILAIGFVALFTISVLFVVRWRLYHAQKELQEQEKEIALSMNKIAMGEMAANIAHEINNPLLSLSLQMTVMKEKYKHSEFHDHFYKMDHMIQRMARMVSGLRDLSRKEAETTMEEFLFSDTLEDVLAVSSKEITAAGITLSINGDFELKTRGHSVQVSQILINLLNNSIDAVKKDNERWIKIEVSKKNSFLQVSVTDSGKGISEYVSHKIMEPFFTTKPSGTGTGLGLSISRTIAEKNHGKLYYDSASERTRFVLLLPLAN